MNLLLIDVVVALLEKIDLSNLRIIFKINSYKYEVTELMSRDTMQYVRAEKDLIVSDSGHRPAVTPEFYLLKRIDPFQLIARNTALYPANFSDKTTLELEVIVR